MTDAIKLKGSYRSWPTWVLTVTGGPNNIENSEMERGEEEEFNGAMQQDF